MNTKQLILNTLDEHLKTIKVLDDNINIIEDCCVKINETILNRNKILQFGNGGSAVKFTGRFLMERMPLQGISLCTNISTLTTIGNDSGFDKVFSKELEATFNPGDLLIGISRSGNSKNVIEAVKAIIQDAHMLIGNIFCQTVN